jgi:tetratricopeptide (TPR) repeat protein
MAALLREVAAGNPVIVFENLSLSWLPQWHYAIVFGYDLVQQKILMHSGPEAFKWWDLRKFERSWKLGEYWGMVVLPPGALAATADEFAHVRATAALEKIGSVEEAERSYHKILQRWPQSLGANIGLGNITYEKNQVLEAVQYLRHATEYHPQSAPAWHNLALAQEAALMKKAAQRSALRAIELAAADKKSSYSRELHEIIQRQK